MKNINIDDLVKSYNDLKTIKSVAKKHNLSAEYVRQLFIKGNINYVKKKIYSYDKDFFSNDTERSFYWAGFIAADGCISNEGDFCISLKISDIDHIEKFKQDVKSDYAINILPPRDKIICGIKTKTEGSALIRFRAKDWLKPFNKFNIIAAKTKTYTIPIWLSDHTYFRHFIRGYFDGDGWFAKKNGRIYFGICGNLQVMEVFKEIFDHVSGKQGVIIKQNNIYKLSYNSIFATKSIIMFLYNNSNICLDRKYEKSLEAIEICNNSKQNPLDEEKLIAACNKFQSLKDIANEMNCSKSNVFNYIKKWNLR